MIILISSISCQKQKTLSTDGGYWMVTIDGETHRSCTTVEGTAHEVQFIEDLDWFYVDIDFHCSPSPFSLHVSAISPDFTTNPINVAVDAKQAPNSLHAPGFYVDLFYQGAVNLTEVDTVHRTLTGYLTEPTTLVSTGGNRINLEQAWFQKFPY